MDKILVYSYFFYPEENANTNYLTPILLELSKHFEVHVVTYGFSDDALEEEEYKGLHVFRYKIKSVFSFGNYVVDCYHKPLDSISGALSPLKRLVWHTLHHFFNDETIAKTFCAYKTYTNWFKEQIQKHEYVAYISASSPIITQYESLELAQKKVLKKNNIPWFPIFADPHATFIGHESTRDELMKKEMEIYKLATKVFTTKELYESNKGFSLGQYTNKTIPLNYTNLAPISSEFKIDYLDHSKINCVYIGSLFDVKVRNPEYFYQLANACSDDFRFHVVCYAADEKNLLLKEKYVDNSQRITWHNKKTMPECHALMKNADILINLGNLSTNQTPSKIFEYISTGKPIVNFHKLENDTAEYYLQNYPIKLSIKEDDNILQSNTQQFQSYCAKNAGCKELAFDEIKSLYKDYDIASVAEDIVKTLIEESSSIKGV